MLGGSSSGGGDVGCSTWLVETMDKHNPAMGFDENEPKHG